MTRVERTELEIKESISLLQMHLRIAGNPQKYSKVKEKLNKILQDVLLINSQFSGLGEKVKTLSGNVGHAKKSDETAILLSKLKEAYEVKFRDLELSNQNLNQEILDLRKEAQDLTSQIEEARMKSSEKMKILERMEALTEEKEDKIAYLTEEREELRQTAAQTTPSSSLHLQKEIQELQKNIAVLEDSIQRCKESNEKELRVKDTQIENLQRKLNQKEREAQVYKES